MRIDRAMYQVRGIVGCVLALGLAGQAAADPINWIGAGRAGGTTDNLWLDAGNWSPTGLPTITDDVSVSFNEAYNPDPQAPALLIGAGAVARDVSITGFNNGATQNLIARVTGNATFGSLAILNGNAAATGDNVFRINSGVTLTLDGGSATTPTFRTVFRAEGDNFVIPNDGGLIELTGENVFLRLEGRIATAMSITDANAVIDFLDVNTHIGSLTVYSTQEIQNLPQLILAGNLVAADNERLDNFSGVGLGMRRPGGSPGTSITVAAATFGFVDIIDNSTGFHNHTLNLAGDMILDSDSQGDGTGYAVLLNRRGRSTAPGNFALMTLHGYDLTVTSNAAIIVGDPTTPDPNPTYSQLNITGSGGRESTVTLPGSVIVGHSGSIVGDATSALLIGGNLEFISVDAARHNLSLSTVRMVGQGDASNPQTLEVHSKDHGAASHAAGMAEFGIGMLFVGGLGEPTYLKLVDDHDFSDDGIADALYLSDLYIEAGSILDLNGLNVYVNGQLVSPGSGEFGPGTIIPEPATLGLLTLGFVAIGTRPRRRRR